MSLTLYYLSGSQYSWRVWLALEYKGIPYKLKLMSYDAGDFEKPEFSALNPRKRVPVIVNNDFTLYESAAIIEYLEDKFPGEPRLFSTDLRHRAVQRRMIREIDSYFAVALERLANVVLFTSRKQWSQEQIDAACVDVKKELTIWETIIVGDYLAGPLSAVDFALFPQVALLQRIGLRKPDICAIDLIGPTMRAWIDRMETLPCTKKTWPPHWIERKGSCTSDGSTASLAGLK
jgi:glutathione S-transferase